MHKIAEFEALEGRRLMDGSSASVAAVAAEGITKASRVAREPAQLEVVLSYDDLDPVIASMLTSPETISASQWSVLRRVHVLPQGILGATLASRPTAPTAPTAPTTHPTTTSGPSGSSTTDAPTVTDEDFHVYALGNNHYFDKNYGQLDVSSPLLTNIGSARTPSEIDYDNLRTQIQRAADRGQPLIMDIEHLKTDISRYSKAEVNASLAVYQAVIDFVRAENPNVSLGFYATFPKRDYWTPIYYRRSMEALKTDPTGYWAISNAQWTARYQEWQTSNDYLAPIASQVDVIYPSLYTFYDNPQEWQWYAEESINQAARFGKPVVPFIWNRYHQANADLKFQLIDGDFWRTQLETVRSHADGVVLWDFNVDRPQDNIYLADQYTPANAWYNESVDFFHEIFTETHDDA